MNFENLKMLLDEMAGVYYPGIDMCIYKEHKQVFRYQAGYSDVKNKIKVNDKALYYLFSCTKPITCAAALQLFEQGKFLLTDPVSYYLPEFADVKVKEKDESGNVRLVCPRRPMIIKDLFTMMSGLNYNLEAPEIAEVMKATNGNNPTREIVKGISKIPLEFHPGESYKYSLSHDVLGALIEVVSGKRLGEYLLENIFEPCEMKHTGFKVTEQIKAQMPILYNYEGKGSFRETKLENPFIFGEESEYESGGAGLVSCVDDYIKFADAMANGGVSANGERILSPKTIDVMRAPHIPFDNPFDVHKKIEGYTYGLGVRTFQSNTAGGQLSNIGEFGWDGAANSYVIMDPSEKLSVFCAEFLMNCLNHDAPARYTNLIYSLISMN